MMDLIFKYRESKGSSSAINMDYQISRIGTWWVQVRNSRFPSLGLFSPLILFGEDDPNLTNICFKWDETTNLSSKMGFSEIPTVWNHSNSSKAAQLWLLSPINLSFSSRSLRRRNGARERVNESGLCWEIGPRKGIQFWRDHKDFEHGTGWKVCLIDLMVMFEINSHHLKQSKMLASKRMMAFFGWFLKARKVAFSFSKSSNW